MLSDEAGMLPNVVKTLNEWQTTAKAVGMAIDTITIQFPSTSFGTFIWNTEYNDWEIATKPRREVGTP